MGDFEISNDVSWRCNTEGNRATRVTFNKWKQKSPMMIFLKRLTIKYPCKAIRKYVWLWKWLHHESLETSFMWNKGLLFSFPSLISFFLPPHSFHGSKNIIFPCFQQALTLSNTRNASRISSSLSVSFIFRAIIVKNSGKSMVPLPERNRENHQIWSEMFENSLFDKASRKQNAGKESGAVNGA